MTPGEQDRVGRDAPDASPAGTPPSPEVIEALGLLAPPLVGIMTSSYENDRTGLRVMSVQPCAVEPCLICVAVRKGHYIEPLMRDSHHFGLCLVEPTDRLALRKFPEDPPADADDPFDAFSTIELVSGIPILNRGRAAFDCEVVRHFDLEADHEIYVGLVLDAKVFKNPG
ncbi:MAG: flavin reductase family protein [Planctomycetota bacterium]